MAKRPGCQRSQAAFLRDLVLGLRVDDRRLAQLFVDELLQLPTADLLYVVTSTHAGVWDYRVCDLVTDCLIRATDTAHRLECRLFPECSWCRTLWRRPSASKRA